MHTVVIMFTFNHCKHIDYVNDHPALGENTSYIPDFVLLFPLLCYIQLYTLSMNKELLLLL